MTTASDFKQLQEALTGIKNDIDELHEAVLGTGEAEREGLLLETYFVVAAWGVAARAFDICLQKHEKGEEFNAQDELLTQFVLFKEKEIIKYDKVFTVDK